MGITWSLHEHAEPLICCMNEAELSWVNEIEDT
jgi:hypothetical protein